MHSHKTAHDTHQSHSHTQMISIFIAYQHNDTRYRRHSIRPSTRLSVQTWYCCIEINLYIVKLFTSPGRAIILVFSTKHHYKIITIYAHHFHLFQGNN